MDPRRTSSPCAGSQAAPSATGLRPAASPPPRRWGRLRGPRTRYFASTTEWGRAAASGRMPGAERRGLLQTHGRPHAGSLLDLWGRSRFRSLRRCSTRGRRSRRSSTRWCIRRFRPTRSWLLTQGRRTAPWNGSKPQPRSTSGSASSSNPETDPMVGTRLSRQRPTRSSPAPTAAVSPTRSGSSISLHRSPKEPTGSPGSTASTLRQPSTGASA